MIKLSFDNNLPDTKSLGLQRVVDELPKDLRFSKEQRERILEEEREGRHKEKKRHEMADFRIEVLFGSNRSSRKICNAKIRVWESGKRLTGDGDVSMHFCANPHCVKPFSAEYFTGDWVTCPHCHKTCLREQTVTALGPFRREMWEVRALIIQLFETLRANVDIVSVWWKDDIRILDGAKHMDQYKEFELKDYERVVYPHWRIIDDITRGDASFDSLLRAFLG
jgi:hypothetical protein